MFSEWHIGHISDGKCPLNLVILATTNQVIFLMVCGGIRGLGCVCSALWIMMFCLFPWMSIWPYPYSKCHFKNFHCYIWNVNSIWVLPNSVICLSRSKSAMKHLRYMSKNMYSWHKIEFLERNQVDLLCEHRCHFHHGRHWHYEYEYRCILRLTFCQGTIVWE